MSKHHTKPIALIIGVFTLSLAISYLVLAWTEPTLAPPDGNVAAPINAGSVGQSKAGGLILNTGGADDGLFVYGTSTFNDSVGIGTADPGTYKLKVAGTAYIADDVTMGGDLTFAPVANRTISIGVMNVPFDLTIQPGYNEPLSESGNLIFATGQGTERMRINKYGNVGVGTTTPATSLTVDGTATFAGAISVSGSMGDAGQTLISQGADNAPMWGDAGGGSETATGYLEDSLISDDFSRTQTVTLGFRPSLILFHGFVTTVGDDPTNIPIGYGLNAYGHVEPYQMAIYQDGVGTVLGKEIRAFSNRVTRVLITTSYLFRYYEWTDPFSFIGTVSVGSINNDGFTLTFSGTTYDTWTRDFRYRVYYVAFK